MVVKNAFFTAGPFLFAVNEAGASHKTRENLVIYRPNALFCENRPIARWPGDSRESAAVLPVNPG